MPVKPKHPAAKKAAKPALPLVEDTAPKQSRIHPTLEAWLSHPENVIRLRQILADPVFVAACHYVESVVNVMPEDLVGAQAALDAVIVRKAAMATGVRIFTKALASLPGLRKKKPGANPEPWEHIQAPSTP